MRLASSLLAASLAALIAATPTLAAPAGTVTLGMQGDWDSLDPHRLRNFGGMQMAMTLYDRLAAIDGEGKIVPSLAQSWDVAADGITARIRPGATCADGSPVTPAVVARSFRRLGSPDTKAPYLVRAFGGGGLDSVTSDDAAGTVTIKLKAAYSDLLISLAMPWSSVVCGAGLDQPDTLAEKPSGSGPFKLDEARRGDQYRFAARPDYAWGPNGSGTGAPGFPATLVVRVIQNFTTSANLLTTGELNAAFVSGRDVERLRKEASLKSVDKVAFGADGLVFHQGPDHPAADPVVRKALSLAVDSNAYNRAANFTAGQAMASLTTPSMQCYDKDVGKASTGHDPAAARKLLEGAGWKANAAGLYEKAGQTLKLRLIGYKLQNAGPEYLLEAFRAIGVDASLTVSDVDGWFDTVSKTQNWDATAFPLSSIMPSPSIFYAQLAGNPPPGGSNYAMIRNEGYTKAAQEALAAKPDERCAKWAAAEKLQLGAIDAKPLSVRVSPVFYRGISAPETLGSALMQPLSLRLAP